MDTLRLPAYRFSYLLRFHPYPRAKPSVRERIEASAREHEQLQMDIMHLESDAASTLNQAVHDTKVHNEIPSQERDLSMSPLVLDLALSTTEKQTLQD